MTLNTTLLFKSLFFCVGIFGITTKEIHAQQKTDSTEIITYNFLDFKVKKGAIPFYLDKKRKSIAINAAKYGGQFSSALLNFTGDSGKYYLQLTTFREEDGESTYKIYVDGKLKKSFQNPPTEKPFEKHVFPLKKIRLKKGSIIEIKFNAHSNGKIPEKDGFAFARGRLQSIAFVPKK